MVMNSIRAFLDNLSVNKYDGIVLNGVKVNSLALDTPACIQPSNFDYAAAYTAGDVAQIAILIGGKYRCIFKYWCANQELGRKSYIDHILWDRIDYNFLNDNMVAKIIKIIRQIDYVFHDPRNSLNDIFVNPYHSGLIDRRIQPDDKEYRFPRGGIYACNLQQSTVDTHGHREGKEIIELRDINDYEILVINRDRIIIYILQTDHDHNLYQLIKDYCGSRGCSETLFDKTKRLQLIVFATNMFRIDKKVRELADFANEVLRSSNTKNARSRLAV